MSPDLWLELLEAWEAWTRHPSDRNAVVRLTEASRPVALMLGVHAFQVSDLLADGLREGLTPPEVVDALRRRAEGE